MQTEYTAKEAAKFLGLDDQQFCYRRRQGRIPFKEVGEGKDKRYVFDPEKTESDPVQSGSSIERLKAAKLGMEVKKIQQTLMEDRVKIAEQVCDIANAEILLPILAEMKNIIAPEMDKLKPETVEKWNRVLTSGLTERQPVFLESIRAMLSR